MELSTVALWLNTAFSGFDQAVTLAVHKLYDIGGLVFTPFMELISLMGKGGIFLIILSLALMFFRKTRRYGTAMAFGLLIGVCFVNLFLKVVVARPRPYADENSIYYQLWLIMGQHMESDKSFPSGHTNAAFAAMVPLYLLGDKKKSWLALVFAVLMGISRIYLVVHFPSDVVGGLITGTIAGMLGSMIALNLPKKWYVWDLVKRGGRPEEDDECSDLAS